MKGHVKQLSVGLLSGAVLSLLLLGGGLLLGSMQGWLVILWPEESIFSGLWNWIYNNLKESIFVFAVVLALWISKLLQLKKSLLQKGSLTKVNYIEHMLDIYAGLFFGIGVVFTAIGMRSALLQALGNLDAVTAAEQGAFIILQRLVDGGILLALSTTIVGGIGGYLMRMTKSIWLGSSLVHYYMSHREANSNLLLERISSIESHVKSLTKSGKTKEQ